MSRVSWLLGFVLLQLPSLTPYSCPAVQTTLAHCLASEHATVSASEYFYASTLTFLPRGYVYHMAG